MTDRTGRLPLCLALVAVLGGCKLIDQRTFASPGQRPSPSQLAAASGAGPTLPLVTLRFAGEAFDYKPTLAQAIAAAEERKPGAEYQVVTLVPAKGDAASQAKALERAQGNAVAVMDAMRDDGVDGDRMHLSARTAAAIDAPEVRVYVN